MKLIPSYIKFFNNFGTLAKMKMRVKVNCLPSNRVLRAWLQTQRSGHDCALVFPAYGRKFKPFRPALGMVIDSPAH
jgi:hypothetical protein